MITSLLMFAFSLVLYPDLACIPVSYGVKNMEDAGVDIPVDPMDS